MAYNGRRSDGVPVDPNEVEEYNKRQRAIAEIESEIMKQNSRGTGVFDPLLNVGKAVGTFVKTGNPLLATKVLAEGAKKGYNEANGVPVGLQSLVVQNRSNTVNRTSNAISTGIEQDLVMTRKKNDVPEILTNPGESVEYITGNENMIAEQINDSTPAPENQNINKWLKYGLIGLIVIILIR